MKKRLLGHYDYTVILTYCGMLFAFCGILRAVSQNYWEAVFCLMSAGFCDMFDGAVASTKADRTADGKRFGIQIDSLSDLVSFGVLPGVFVYMITGKNAAVGLICALFVLCALIRLAYFNVLEEKRQEQTDRRCRSFLGVPVTTSAILLPFFLSAPSLQDMQNQHLFSDSAYSDGNRVPDACGNQKARFFGKGRDTDSRFF